MGLWGGEQLVLLLKTQNRNGINGGGINYLVPYQFVKKKEWLFKKSIYSLTLFINFSKNMHKKTNKKTNKNTHKKDAQKTHKKTREPKKN